MNERIRVPKVRVIAPDGRQLGIMDTREAVEKAKIVGLDLVMVTETVNPPVCRIVEYGKWRYEQSKLKKNKVKPTAPRMKEVKFRVRTEAHDYNIKMSRMEQFLDAGSKVRVQLQFRGREMAHQEIGMEVMHKVKEDIKQMANVDLEPRKAGRSISMVLSPLPKEQRKRKFHLAHGELIDEDDFDDDDENFDDEEGEDIKQEGGEES